MLDWAQQHVDLLNLALNTLMVVIWLVYLQLFLVGFLRQRRAVLHIDRGAAKDENARCIVTNMGSEPTYLVAVVVDIIRGDRRDRVAVTDRDEVSPENINRPLEKTNQGPLTSGQAVDVGSFWALVERARLRLGGDLSVDDLDAIVVTAVAASNQGQQLEAGTKRFTVSREFGPPRFDPDRVLTRQIRSPFRRRDLEEFLNQEGEV